METDLSFDPAAADLEDAVSSEQRLMPIGVDLVELARWGALFVSTALAAHQQPGELAAQAQVFNVAAVLQRMLGRLRLPVEGSPQRQRRRGKA